MAVQTFLLPDPGEGLTEAEIVTWNVAPGDTVKVNDVVVEIETSKSLVELPIPWAGTVVDILVPAGVEVPVGTPIITVETGVAGSDDPATGAGGAATPVTVTDPAVATAPAPLTGDTAGSAPAREPNLVGYGAIAGSTTRRPRKRPTGAASPGAASVGTGATGGPITGAGTVATAAPSHGVASAGVGAGAGAGAAGGAAPGGTQTPAAPAPPPASPTPARPAPAATTPAPSTPAATDQAGRPLTKPTIRRYCRDRGIDLTLVRGTGPDGVITWEDVDAHVTGSSAPATSTDACATTGAARFVSAEREVRVPVKGVRKHTAHAMSASAFTAPHVTEFVTVDVSASMELVDRLKADREFADVKVSPLLLVAKAVVLACRRNPGVNAVWEAGADGDVIVQKNYVNLGIAAATPRGLVVPNIKDADAMNLRELAGALGDLVATARAGRTQPADMSGGTITITNVGVFGVDTGTPIINPGEAAILCFGAVRRMPWVVGSGADERIEARWVTQLSLSFDHRLVDGDLGSRFLADVAAVLADPAKGLVWG